MMYQSCVVASSKMDLVSGLVAKLYNGPQKPDTKTGQNKI